MREGESHDNCLICRSVQDLTVILKAPATVLERIESEFLEDETDQPDCLKQLQTGGVYSVTLEEWWDDEDWYLRISDVVAVFIPDKT